MTHPVSTIAKLLLLDERRVQQLAKEGVIPKEARGTYELVPAVQGYIRYLRRGEEGTGAEGKAKQREATARADILEMKAQRLKGELIPGEAVEAVWAAAAGRFRQRMLALPVKAAPLVAPESETDVCHEILEAHVHEALAELAATPIEEDGGDPEGAGIGDPSVALGAEGGSTAAKADRKPVGRRKKKA